MLSASLVALASTAIAQEMPSSTDNAVITYEAAFFEEFSPVTALDMVSQIPGFSLDNGDTQRRGLADVYGNLLVNGQRPSDKSIDLETILGRIPASEVVSIELIREPVAGYEMRGHGQLANVIVREASGGSSAFSARLNHFAGHRLGSYVTGSITRSFGETEVTAALAVDWRGPRVLTRDRDFNADGSAIEEAFDSNQRIYRALEPSASILTPLGANTRLRINARGGVFDLNRGQQTEVYAPSRALGPLSRYEVIDGEIGGWLFSSTATLDHTVSDALSAQTVLTVIRRVQEDNEPETSTVFDPPGPSRQVIVGFGTEREETALRQTFNWTLSPRHSVQFGAETAFNARETDLEVSLSSNGTLTPVDIPVANTRVEEQRGELSVRHVWAMSDNLNLTTGLRYEVSEISQSGDAQQERDFSYLKPEISLTWSPDDRRRWRFEVSRNVEQLDFGKFASSVDLTSDQIDVGNPDYRPQSDWTIEAQVEQRFGEDSSVTITLGREWIENLDDFIAVRDRNGNIFDAPGNIGDATLNRITLESSLALDRIGLSNANLDGFVEWYGTNVTDPVTGLDRAWSGFREWEARFDFRQNFPDRQMAWGWDYTWYSDAAFYRASEFREAIYPTGDFDIYVETTRFYDLTMRLGADFVFDSPSKVRRTFYTGSRADGVVSRVRETVSNEGVTGYFQVRGAF